MKTMGISLLVLIALCGAFTSFSQTWTQTGGPSRNWTAAAASADGTKLVAAANFIWISTNSGTTWIQTNAFTVTCRSIASSADGNNLVAACTGGIFLSTNSGINWMQANTGWPLNNGNLTGAASSSDGTKLVVTIGYYLAPIYTSTDSGTTWISNTVPLQNWQAVASSADGNKLVAVGWSNSTSGLIYLSTNAGANWLPSNAPNRPWACVASSADGTKLVAAGGQYNFSGIYTSTNSGLTWQSNSVPATNWISVASSADGINLVAAAAPQFKSGLIFTSTNSGTTWISNNVPNTSWPHVASSADGNKLIAVTQPLGGGYIYRSQTIPKPTLNIEQTNSNLALSWLIPSTNFVLQQNSNLTTANWSDVTNAPVLNLTNLQNQVTLPAPAGRIFYRLKTP